MPFTNLAYASERREERDEVHHRTRAVGGDGRELPVTIVNISPNGLMARCDAGVETGLRLHFSLPGLGAIHAEIRWVLGGRIGCEFERSIPPQHYYALLPRLER